jgi:hypothetical protein
MTVRSDGKPKVKKFGNVKPSRRFGFGTWISRPEISGEMEPLADLGRVRSLRMSCAQAYLIIKEVQERLGSNLRFVFRSFPLTKVRPHAYQAALKF